MSDSFHNGWIGVDFDGTLAFYGAWNPEHPLGDPIPAMLERVKLWLSQGRDVRIVTARAGEEGQTELIEAWCEEHIGQKLVVTDRKDFKMAELWDDRAVRVHRNHGGRCCGHPETFEQAWERMEEKGYRYDEDAIEKVRLGFALARGEL